MSSIGCCCHERGRVDRYGESFCRRLVVFGLWPFAFLGSRVYSGHGTCLIPLPSRCHLAGDCTTKLAELTAEKAYRCLWSEAGSACQNGDP